MKHKPIFSNVYRKTGKLSNHIKLCHRTKRRGNIQKKIDDN